MVVTEFAIFTANSSEALPALKQHIEATLPVLKAWHQKTYPQSPIAPAPLFQQVEDPSKVLLTFCWDSVEAHWAWIETSENKTAMGGINELIKMEGEDKMKLFHLDAEVFPAPAPGEGDIKGLLESGVVMVARMVVGPEKRQRFQDAWVGVKGLLETHAGGEHLVRTGWRVDKDGEYEEFVLIAGFASIERHYAFARHPGFGRYMGIFQFVTKNDVRHYRRLL
jgi:heme-degrading monooxygenase HmoA